MTTTPLPLVIYHANCADGFTAAWAVHKAMAADFHPAAYATAPPDVTGRDVIMVDFCYKPEIMRDLQRKARSILVLDHHKSADEDLPDNPDVRGLMVFRMDPEVWNLNALAALGGMTFWDHHLHAVAQDRRDGLAIACIFAMFDQTRSGAGIAWDFFHPGAARPALVNHVEDRDLWRLALEGTREIQAAVFSRPYTFADWDELAAMDPQELRREGAAIDRKHHKDVAELVNVCGRRMVIGGYDVPAASMPYTMTSDAGALMAQGEPFAACYWDTAEMREFSLRSHSDGLDVSAIARIYGGGGHARAAGFRVPRDHSLAMQ